MEETAHPDVLVSFLSENPGLQYVSKTMIIVVFLTYARLLIVSIFRIFL